MFVGWAGGRALFDLAEHPRCGFVMGVPTASRSSDGPASAPFPACPFLPAPRPGLDWRCLHQFRESDRGPAFYVACLEYGQALWQRRLAARALLCLDRAFGAELTGAEPELRAWPLPYAATAWVIANTPSEVFIGNPRVHFQHYADRMNAPRRAQRQARAWACWALTRAVRQELPGDPRHVVREPGAEDIFTSLQREGHPGEAELWQSTLKNVAEISAERSAR